MATTDFLSRGAVVTTAAGLVLAACVGNGVIVTRTDYAYAYDPLEVSAAGGGDRQLPVKIFGNPFEGPKPDFDSAVVSSMPKRPSGIDVNFATEPTNTDPQRPYRVVLAFNPVSLNDPMLLCAAGDDVSTRASQPGAELRVFGALCSGNRSLSHTVARAPVADIAAPNFRPLIAQLTLALFPPENPNRKGESESPSIITP